MTRTPGRVIAVMATTALIAAGLVGSALPAAGGVNLHGDKVLTPHGLSRGRESYYAVAGSDRRLVSEVGPATDDLEWENSVLQVRSKAGHVQTLGDTPDDSGWSTLGHYLVAEQGRDSTASNPVDIWDLSSGLKTTYAIAAGDRMLAAAPNGVVYAAGDDLRDHGADGSDVDWGVPFAGQSILSAAVDSTRIVVTDDNGDIAVMSYSNPGTFTPLVSGTGSGAICYALDRVGAACSGDDDTVRFVPLDGGTPTPDSDQGDFAYVALAGSTMLTLIDDDSTDDSPSPLCAVTLGDSTPTCTSKPVLGFGTDYNYDVSLVSAYGEAVITETGHKNVRAASSYDNLAPLFAGPKAPETASTFALAHDRVVYVSDATATGGYSSSMRLRAASITASSTHVAVHLLPDITPKHAAFGVSGGTFNGVPSVAATDTTTAYREVKRRHGRDIARVRVVGPQHDLTLSSQADSVQLAGHYLDSDTGTHIEVYDVRTGHRVLRLANQRGQALTAHALYYGRHYGTIHKVDLTTGRNKRVFSAPAQPSGHALTGPLAAHGHWVAWSLYGHHATTHYLMNTRTGRVVDLPDEAYALTSKGALLDSGGSSLDEASIWFMPYSGHLEPVLSPRFYDQLPELDGHALAWISSEGNLHVAPYKY